MNNLRGKDLDTAKTRWRRLKLALSRLGTGILFFIFCVGLVGCAFRLFLFDRSIDPSTQSSKWEVPLTEINHVESDSSGNIYVGVQAYQRIQVYSGNGNFIRSISVKLIANGGMFSFSVSPDGTVVARGVRTGNTAVFTPGEFQMYGASGSRYAKIQSVNSDGLVVRESGWSWFWPRIARTTNGGLETKVSQPLRLWIIGVPIPSMIFMTVPLFVALLTRKKREVNTLTSK